MLWVSVAVVLALLASSKLDAKDLSASRCSKPHSTPGDSAAPTTDSHSGCLRCRASAAARCALAGRARTTPLKGAPHMYRGLFTRYLAVRTVKDPITSHRSW
jgi:hypothetical protein